MEYCRNLPILLIIGAPWDVVGFWRRSAGVLINAQNLTRNRYINKRNRRRLLGEIGEWGRGGGTGGERGEAEAPNFAIRDASRPKEISGGDSLVFGRA